MVNKVILVGNVGVDPEVRSLEGGVKMARVRLATSERFFNRETQQAKEHTEWHTIIFWRNLAEVVDRFVRKGSQIYVEGRLRGREWEDQSGVKRYTIEVVADELKLLGRRPDGAQPSAPAAGAVPPAAPQPDSAPSPAPAAAPEPPVAAPTYEVPQSAPAVQSPMNDPDDLPF